MKNNLIILALLALIATLLVKDHEPEPIVVEPTPSVVIDTPPIGSDVPMEESPIIDEPQSEQSEPEHEPEPVQRVRRGHYEYRGLFGRQKVWVWE